jgi:3-phosphoshikimate 1-carboxyvinyltransferase
MTSSRQIMPAAAIRGRLSMPGDKSISHRALVLGAIADGESTIHGRAAGEDQESMVRCLQALDVRIQTDGDLTLVGGVGLRGLRSPLGELDCGNSGATMRFLTGVLAGVEGVEAVLVGDASLSTRPMARVADPLRRMGAEIGTSPAGLPPVVVSGRQLRGADHHLAIGSAQVKTAILLAGLNADGQTYIISRDTGRDHTERMLRQLGVDIESADAIRLRPPSSIPAFEMTVPGDPSSAAFWLVLGAIHPDAEVSVTGVCVNPTRSGFIDVLQRMGADIRLSDEAQSGGEPTATVTSRSSTLSSTEIDSTEVSALLDEIPILSVAAACAQGTSVFKGLSELRLKEVDRVAAISGELSRMGAEVGVAGDDLVIRGGRGLRGAMVDSRGDHRLAMSLAVAATVAHGPTELAGAGAAAVSYPAFFDILISLSGATPR